MEAKEHICQNYMNIENGFDCKIEKKRSSQLFSEDYKKRIGDMFMEFEIEFNHLTDNELEEMFLSKIKRMAD